MKNLTTAIFAKMTSTTALYADVAGRLFKGRAPARAAYPYIVFIIVADVPDKTFTEDYEDVLIQFSLFSAASGSTEIDDMYKDLKALYDECALTIPPTGAPTDTLIWMKRTNAILMIDDHTIPGGGTTQVWHYAVDYEILTSLI